MKEIGEENDQIGLTILTGSGLRFLTGSGELWEVVNCEL